MPVWLGSASLSQGIVFAILFFLDSIARTIVLTVIPLQALRLLGDAQRVSVLYFGAGLFGLCTSLAIPWLVRRLRRRRVFTLGALCMLAAAGSFATQNVVGLAIGLGCQLFGTACLGISMNLYVMDHISRRDLGRFEPMRTFFVATGWALGPWLGVWLAMNIAPLAPFAVSALGASVTLGFFWFLRLTDNPAVASTALRSPNPLRYLPRYFAQPRLRLAWVLAVGRSSWWSMFYVYAPIYAVVNGFDSVAGGAIVSIGSASLYLVPIWGWIGRRYGFRILLIVGYAAGGAVTIAVAAVADAPWLGAVLLVGAALGASVVDGAGNVPFLRAVRPLERAEMTTVFMTYRNAAQFAPPGIFAALLRVFDLPAVFIAGGGAMLVMARLAHYIPRRM